MAWSLVVWMVGLSEGLGRLCLGLVFWVVWFRGLCLVVGWVVCVVRLSGCVRLLRVILGWMWGMLVFRWLVVVGLRIARWCWVGVVTGCWVGWERWPGVSSRGV